MNYVEDAAFRTPAFYETHLRAHLPQHLSFPQAVEEGIWGRLPWAEWFAPRHHSACPAQMRV